MYVPDAFAVTDAAFPADLMRQHNFGLLVTAPDGEPQASHLPFFYDASSGGAVGGPGGSLFGHMARANPQWKDFAALAERGREALVIFQGPHGYISPTWYGDAGPAVPTWNYAAVHAYGLPAVIHDQAEVRTMMDCLVERQEAHLPSPWSTAGQDEAFMRRMLRGIVAFEIPLTRLDCKAKLSQNKSDPVRERTAAAMKAQNTGDSEALADLMLAQAPSPAR